MARMVPGLGPREYDPRSREGDIYTSLASIPSDDFVVVHSMDLVSLYAGVVRQNEADFVVFHKGYGILCIEAKAGAVYYQQGDWCYSNGALMKHGGPFKQAENCKYRIRDVMDERGLSRLRGKCKVCHAVWFPSIDRSSVSSMDLPPEAVRDQILCKDDLLDPLPAILRAFECQGYNVETDLSQAEADLLISKVLCPEFELVPSSRLTYDLADIRFLRLLDSQMRVLDFLQDQRSAVINGAAGTGKTLIALERARRAAQGGGRVLMLCYNSLLKRKLSEDCASDDRIDVYSIAGFACSVCSSSTPDYDGLAEALMGMTDSGSFSYDHVIVDEGQDFGVAAIEEAGVLELLRELALSREGGTFYVFYDKRQFVQGSRIPAVVSEADCKLTLYVNCRNTRSIATCSLRGISETSNDIVRRSVQDNSPVLLYASSDVGEQARFVEAQISALRAAGLTTVVLTCATEERSALSDWFSRNPDGDLVWVGSHVPVYSCRRFKGLEADAVILIDVSSDDWAEPENDYEAAPGLVFYTGASRAKHELRVVCDMDEAAALKVVEALGGRSRRKPYLSLAKRLNTNLVERV